MPKQFIDFEIYIVSVDPEKCDGCRQCVEICPGEVFWFSIKADPLKPQNCLGCRTCEAICKSAAILITEI